MYLDLTVVIVPGTPGMTLFPVVHLVIGRHCAPTDFYNCICVVSDNYWVHHARLCGAFRRGCACRWFIAWCRRSPVSGRRQLGESAGFYVAYLALIALMGPWQLTLPAPPGLFTGKRLSLRSVGLSLRKSRLRAVRLVVDSRLAADCCSSCRLAVAGGLVHWLVSWRFRGAGRSTATRGHTQVVHSYVAIRDTSGRTWGCEARTATAYQVCGRCRCTYIAYDPDAAFREFFRIFCRLAHRSTLEMGFG